MLTRKDIPRLLLAGLKTNFFSAYKGVSTFYDQVSTEIPSSKASEVYAWLGATPTLRKWRDEKLPKGLAEFGFTIVNEDYEATISIDRNALEDDQYGQVATRAKQLGISAAKGYDEQFTVVLEAGTTTVCYDGQNFFDTDHQEGSSGIQSNYSASSMALSATNAKTIFTTMENYKDDTGKLCGVSPTHIMVPTALRFTAKEIFDPATVAVTTDPAKKLMAGMVDIIVNPYLTNNGANSAYYLLDLSGAVRPFIFQNRKPMTFVSLDKDTDYDVFMRKELYYSAEARFAFGFGDWRYAYKAQG